MQIKLKSLHLENFKGVKSLDVAFGDKTKIKGQNASGKTTVFDAFTWLLFNKNCAGDEKFQVRPLDAAGKQKDNVEIKVVAVLVVDGTEVMLSKVQKQNWVKHRNSTAPTLEGNVNVFEIDGYPKFEKDYKAYISGMVTEDLFKMLTNPAYFPGRHWKDQRDILMKLVPDICDSDLAHQLSIVDGEDTHKFDSLIVELKKAPSTDDIQKKFSKALSEWKKKQSEIPVRIDELSKSLVQIDVAEQELAKSDLERRIAEIDVKIKDAGSAISTLRSEEMKLQFDMSGIMQMMNRQLYNKRGDIDTEIFRCKSSINSLREKISLKEKIYADNLTSIEDSEKKRSELGAEYNAEKSKVFDETPYIFHEEEWQFDESSTICSLCGQELPFDQVEKIKEEFEAKKERAKDYLAKSLQFYREKFDSEKKDALERIKAKGFEQKHIIEDLTAKNEALQAEIESLKNQEQEATAKLNELSKRLEELPDEADYSQNEEYTKLKARHDEVLAEIAKADSLGHDELMAQFEEEKKELLTELDSVNVEIAKASKNVEIEDRICELKEEQKEVGQKVADQEKMLYLLEDFIRSKMMKISDSVNQHFKTVNFKLFDMQLNGGLKECCECTVNGVPYSTLNSGHRIIAGLDIIQSLSELYGVTAPIFIDNAESLNEFNVPDMAAQMILLSVSDDSELKVEVE